MKPQVWRKLFKFKNCSSVAKRNISYFSFYFKTIKITTNNPILFYCLFAFKTTQILLYFIEKYYSSPKIIYKLSKKLFQFFEDILAF